MNGKHAQKNFGAVGAMAPTPLSLKTLGGGGGWGVSHTRTGPGRPPPWAPRGHRGHPSAQDGVGRTSLAMSVRQITRSQQEPGLTESHGTQPVPTELRMQQQRIALSGGGAGSDPRQNSALVPGRRDTSSQYSCLDSGPHSAPLRRASRATRAEPRGLVVLLEMNGHRRWREAPPRLRIPLGPGALFPSPMDAALFQGHQQHSPGETPGCRARIRCLTHIRGRAGTSAPSRPAAAGQGTGPDPASTGTPGGRCGRIAARRPSAPQP